MKISVESELMKNHKQAVLAPSALTFEVVQSREGDTIFFSLEGGDTDKVLYATREITNSTSASGWQKIALSSSLPSIPSPYTVKMFAITQNPTNMALDIALVATDPAQGVDYFFLSLGHANDTAAWASPMVWTYYKFDNVTSAGTTPPLEIVDIFVMNNRAQENFFVDILRDPGQSDYIDRFFIEPSNPSGPKWKSHTVGSDMQKGLITSCLGRRRLPNSTRPDFVPCIYTLGDLGNGTELVYTPSYSLPGMNSTPPALLSLPSDPNSTNAISTYAIASAALSDGTTNLFVASSDGLYVFPPDSQYADVPCKKIIPQSSIGDISLFGSGMSLVASTVASTTTIWCLNQGMLFQLYCAAGSEIDPGAWCNPFPFSTGVQAFAFYLNYPLSYNVLFARTSDATLVKYTQDPNTTVWRQQTVILPSDSTQDLLEYNTFTSHISVTDDYGTPSRGEAVSIVPDSPVSVSVNGLHTNLESSNFKTDVTGCISIVQETQSLSAVCFTATLSDGTALRIDPLSNASNTLSGVTSSSDSTALKNVQITTADGQTGPLVDGTSVTDDNLDTAATAMNQLMSKKQDFESSDTLQAVQSSEVLVSSHDWNHRGAKMPKHVRDLAPHRDNSRLSHEPLLGGVVSWFKCAMGDLVQGAKAIADKVDEYVIQTIEGEAENIYHLCVTIGQAVYHAVLDTVSAVVSAIDFVLHEIEVGIEKLVAWLGFLFGWSDILRTHRVIRKTLLLYFKKVADGIDSIEDNITACFQKLEGSDSTDVPDSSSSIGVVQQSQASNPPAGSKSPQAHWAVQHTNNGMSSAQGGDSSSASDPDADTSDFDTRLQNLGNSFTSGLIDNLDSTCQDIKTQIFDQINSLKPGEAVTKILEIMGKDILGDAKDIILALVDVLKYGVAGLLDLLDVSLDIPVLSALYRQITGDNLSFLDLICLIGAIPATICFKLIGHGAPFPSDDDYTYSQINDQNTQEWEQLTQIVSGNSLESVAALEHSPKRHTKGRARHETPLQPFRLGDSAYSVADVFQFIFNVVGSFGGLASLITASLKRPYDVVSKTPPMLLQRLDFLAYGLYCCPDFFSYIQDSGEGYSIFNDAVTLLSIAKKALDNFGGMRWAASQTYKTYSSDWSPWLEMILNVIWVAPAGWSFAESCKNDSEDGYKIIYDVGALIQNLVFDVGGILTPFTSVAFWEKREDPAALETAAGFFDAALWCYAMCSGMSLGLAVSETLIHKFD